MKKADEPVRTVEPGEAFVTTDAMAARAVPAGSYDPAGALAAAEAQRRRVSRQDTLLALRDRRKITAAELRAAHEIAAVVGWTEDANAPMARSQFRERMDASTGGDAGARWLWLLEAEHTRYAPWRDWAMRQRANAVGISLETLTRAVVVLGWGMRRAEKAFGLRHGSAVKHLRTALHRYASAAGWQGGAEPPDPSTGT